MRPFVPRTNKNEITTYPFTEVFRRKTTGCMRPFLPRTNKNEITTTYPVTLCRVSLFPHREHRRPSCRLSDNGRHCNRPIHHCRLPHGRGRVGPYIQIPPHSLTSASRQASSQNRAARCSYPTHSRRCRQELDRRATASTLSPQPIPHHRPGDSCGGHPYKNLEDKLQELALLADEETGRAGWDETLLNELQVPRSFAPIHDVPKHTF